MTVDRRAHLEAVDDAAEEVEVAVDAHDRFVDLFALLHLELGLAPDALLQQVALVLVVLHLILGALVLVGGDQRVRLLHQLLVAREGALEVADLLADVEQLILEHEVRGRERELRVAQLIEVLEQARLRLDVLFLRAGIGEAQDQIALLHRVAALDVDLLDDAALFEIQVHGSVRLYGAIDRHVLFEFPARDGRHAEARGFYGEPRAAEVGDRDVYQHQCPHAGAGEHGNPLARPLLSGQGSIHGLLTYSNCAQKSHGRSSRPGD